VAVLRKNVRQITVELSHNDPLWTAEARWPQPSDDRLQHVA
jgi:hypothetical protein